MEVFYFLASSFKAGGVFMYGILLVLALGTAILIERFLTLFVRARLNGRAHWRKLEGLMQEHKEKKALEFCREIPSPLGRVWTSGLQKALENGVTPEEIEASVEATMLEVLPSLEKRVHYLYSLSNVATLLGLLGTVVGLIRSFSAISLVDPAEKSALLANGISLALNNTAFGLLVAIVLMLSYSFIQARSARLGDELDEFSVRFVQLLKFQR